MPNIQWTTPEQVAFLTARQEAFEKARDADQLSTFFPPLYQEWFDDFPGEETQDPDELKAKEKRIYRWYFNHSTTTRVRQTKVLSLCARTRKMHSYQAYLSLYKKELVPKLHKEWLALKNAPDGAARMKEVAYRTLRLPELLEKEDDHVKERVEKVRNGILEQVDGVWEDELEDDDAREEWEALKQEERKRAIEMLAPSIHLILANIQRETGMVASVIVGGYDPTIEGLAMTSFHHGKSKNALKTWNKADKEWQKVEQSFESFLWKVFPEYGKKRVRVKVEEELTESEDEKPKKQLKKHSAHEDASLSDNESTRSKRKPGNQRRNALPLEQESTSDDLAEHEDPPRLVSKRTQKSGTTVERLLQSVRASLAALPFHVDDSDDDSDDNSSVDETYDLVTKRLNVHELTSRDQRKFQTQARALVDSHVHPSRRSSTVTTVPIPPALKKPIIPAAATGKGVAQKSKVAVVVPKRSAPHRSTASVSGPATSAPHRSSAAASVPAASAPHKSSAAALVTAKHADRKTQSYRIPDAGSKAKPSTTGVRHTSSHSPRKQPIIPVPSRRYTANFHDQSGSDGESNHESSPSVLDVSGDDAEDDDNDMERPEVVAAWKTVLRKRNVSPDRALHLPDWANAALAYFDDRKPLRCSQFCGMKKAWTGFEAFMDYGEGKGRMILPVGTGRPGHLTQWINDHRSYAKFPVLSSKEVKAYGKTVRQWWLNLQPKWRHASGYPVLQDDPRNDDTWEPVCRAGPNGVFLVVMAIAWWLDNSKGKIGEDVAELMDDVTWVLKSMGKDRTVLKSSRKRQAVDIPPQPRKGAKRARKDM